MRGSSSSSATSELLSNVSSNKAGADLADLELKLIGIVKVRNVDPRAVEARERATNEQLRATSVVRTG